MTKEEYMIAIVADKELIKAKTLEEIELFYAGLMNMAEQIQIPLDQGALVLELQGQIAAVQSQMAALQSEVDGYKTCIEELNVIIDEKLGK